MEQNFQGSENTLYGTVNLDMCHYMFVEIHRICSAKSEPECKLWTLDGDNVYYKMSPVTTDAPVWWEVLIIGETVYLWEYSIYVVSPYVPLSFAMNLKLLKNCLKKIVH